MAQGGAVGPGEALAVPLTVAGWVVQVGEQKREKKREVVVACL